MIPYIEIRADHLQPNERFRRGHRLFVASVIAVTVDQVTVTGRLVTDGNPSGQPQAIELAAGEIIRVETTIAPAPIAAPGASQRTLL